MLAEERRFPGAIKLPGATGAYLIPAEAVQAEVKRRVKP
jgi:hypothetical protein